MVKRIISRFSLTISKNLDDFKFDISKEPNRTNFLLETTLKFENHNFVYYISYIQTSETKIKPHIIVISIHLLFYSELKSIKIFYLRLFAMF